MDIYETPKADVSPQARREFKPIKGLFIGLLISIFVAGGVSFLVSVGFALMMGLDFQSNDFEKILASNVAYLMIDMLVSTLILFLAGQAVAKRTPQQELKYGLIFAVITLALYFVLMILTRNMTTSIYPQWYVITSYILSFIAILLGAQSMIKKSS